MKSATTLRITLPVGQTIGLAFVILALAVIAAEIVARSPWVRFHYPFPGVNSPNPDLDEGLRELDRAINQDGKIGCVVLGTSMVRTNFDPVVFRETYRQKTRVDLKCISFGVGGMVAAQAGDLARIISQTYRPSLLIVGVSARDFSSQVAEANILNADDMIRTPWVRYRLGEDFSVEGWLIENSYAYHYSMGLQNVLRSWAPALPGESNRSTVDLTQPPDPIAESGSYAIFANYRVSDEGVAGMAKVLTLTDQGIEVIVVEMPVHPTYHYFFGHGQKDLQAFRTTIAALAEKQGVRFWPTDANLAVPDDGWNDRNHLNGKGRTVFSEWLADKVANAYRQNWFHVDSH